MIAALPVLILPRSVMTGLTKAWSHYFLFLCRVFAGIRIEVRGREHLPQGAYLVASKHQSIWETFALIHLFPDPCFILKQDLSYIPVFGWYIKKMRNVPIDRKGGSRTLTKLIRVAHAEIRRDGGRQIVLFPEGTRRPPGAEPQYRFGIAALYSGLDVPCVPVGLNSGVYWPRRSLRLRRGTILVEILPPIAPGLQRDQFFERVQADIEASSNRLLDEAQEKI
jgi:1-acyl-sn-glycerol-3-phosphate acyltransferase